MTPTPSLREAWHDPAECPYCRTKVAEDARACSACGRDVDLVRDLFHEIQSLKVELKQRPTHHGPAGKFAALTLWGLFVRSLYRYGTALALLLLADLVIQFVYDAQVAYLLSAVFTIPVVLGYSMAIRVASTQAIVFALIAAILSGMLGALVLELPAYLLVHAPLLPSRAAEWQEFVRFAVTIAFAFATGIFLAQAIRLKVSETPHPIADRLSQWFLPEECDHRAIGLHAKKFWILLSFAASGGSGVISLVSLLHSQLPNG